tara:strand:- start:238 stop:591 length:354 start_codon:yes stop_codon:yes gene_type:complete
MTWLKEKWEWVVAALVAILAFALGRRGRKIDVELVENKEEEIKVVEETSREEILKKAAVLKEYTQKREELREQYKNAQTELERTTAQRKIELLEVAKNNPEEIDKILMEEFNISRLK